MFEKKIPLNYVRINVSLKLLAECPLTSDKSLNK